MAAQHCACSLEWYFHAAFLKFAAGVAIYVLMNVSRLLAVDAICRLNWRDATPDVFTYTATCDYSGRPLVNPADQANRHLPEPGPDEAPPDSDGGGRAGDGRRVDDAAFRAALKAQLRARCASWEKAALFELAVALCLNVPWIVFLAVLTDDLEYDPHES